MTRAYIKATAMGKPIFIMTDGGKLRIPNWRRREVERKGDNDAFAWGFRSAGSRSTAYSILRAVYGIETARQLQDIFLEEYVSRLDRGRGFRLSLRRLMHIAGGMVARS